MTREEAILHMALRREELKYSVSDSDEGIKAFNMAIEALWQGSALDKIRTEIADIYCGQYCENPLTADAVREMALEIIDKYKYTAESEG